MNSKQDLRCCVPEERRDIHSPKLIGDNGLWEKKPQWSTAPTVRSFTRSSDRGPLNQTCFWKANKVRRPATWEDINVSNGTVCSGCAQCVLKWHGQNRTSSPKKVSGQSGELRPPSVKGFGSPCRTVRAISRIGYARTQPEKLLLCCKRLFESSCNTAPHTHHFQY